MKAIDVLTSEVVEVRFHTQYLVPIADPEKMSSETKTIQSHMNTKDQVDEFLAAGKRLQDSRAIRYDSDFGEEVELESLEVPIEKGSDLVDIQRASASAQARILSRKEEAAAEAVSKAKAESDKADDLRIEARARAILASEKGVT